MGKKRNLNQIQTTSNINMMSSHEQISMEQPQTPQRMQSFYSHSQGHSQSHSHSHSQSHSQGPPSPCATSTATSTASSPATTHSSISRSSSSIGIDYSLRSNKITIRYLPTTGAGAAVAANSVVSSSGSLGNTNGNANANTNGNGTAYRKQHYKYLPPSPSRSVLDPHYASRLYKCGKNYNYSSYNYNNNHNHHIPNNDLQLKPPPGILRSQTPRGSTSGSSSININVSDNINGVFSTPVASVASGSDAQDTQDVPDAPDVPEEASSSASTNYFTPERPRRTTSNTSTLNSSSNSLQYNTPSRGSGSGSGFASGFYTPQSSPASKQRGAFYSPNATPSRSNNRLPPKKYLGKEGEYNSNNTNYNNNNNTAYSDRFIPSRASSNLTFSVWDDCRNNHHNTITNEDGTGGGNNSNPNSPGGDTTSSDIDGGGSSRQDGMGTGTSPNNHQQSQQQPLLNALLRSELLGENLEPSLPPSTMGMSGNNQNHDRNGRQGQDSGYGTLSSSTTRAPLREGGNYLRFGQSRRQAYHDEVYRRNGNGGAGANPTSVIDSFNLSPVGIKSSHRLMNMPQKRKRKIAKVPFKVLDAPSLADDFYLNLVDWSSLNVLAVGLGSCVYLWSACTSKVTKLCELGSSSQDSVTSVSWTQRGTHLAVGINIGEVQIWDTVKCKKIRTMGGHSARIGALSWSGATLASGSRDRLIYLRDVRIQQPFTARLAAHKQEVCGLKWSFDEPAHLASGGNDNKLLVWDIKNHRQPKHRFAEHTAAVKAIAWSPHQHGLLASGGGTADRCIRFWNALSGTSLNAIDTGSQVCNLSWSKNCNEIVSTHGYSLNQIAIWKYPTMQKVATLTGHTYRVLYLAMSPDGSTIVTGAGDETLRFWQVFPGPSSHDKSAGNGLLFPSSPGSILR